MTAYIITMLILFSLSLVVSILSIGVKLSNGEDGVVANAINVVLSLIIITWSLVLLS